MSDVTEPDSVKRRPVVLVIMTSDGQYCVSGVLVSAIPGFQAPLQNVTVAQGRDAIFTCVVENIGGHTVSPGNSSNESGTRVCI